MAYDECGTQVRVSLGTGSLVASCTRPEGHEGQHHVALSRVLLAWEQEAGDAMAETEQAGEPGQAVAAHGGGGARS